MARALLAADGRDRDGTDAAELAALVDRLANRLGQQAVGCLDPQESHVAERAARFAPIFFRWRRLQHRVRRADGPERLCGEWWRGAEEASVLRDYYRVEDEAGRR